MDGKASTVACTRLINGSAQAGRVLHVRRSPEARHDLWHLVHGLVHQGAAELEVAARAIAFGTDAGRNVSLNYL
eukprot:3874779-Pyramimonas_sp.AAC.1